MDDLPFFPLLEIFGGALGILLLFTFILIFQQEKIKEDQKNPNNIGSLLQQKLKNDMGYIVSLYKDSVVIHEKNMNIFVDQLKKRENPLQNYFEERGRLNPDKYINLFVFPGSNDAAWLAEQNIVWAGIDRYNFLVINEELMEKMQNTTSMSLNNSYPSADE